ncbi:transposase [Synechococcus sp. Nb3U1]|uniref:RNA-guided endonuclease InsQ/TnpB family protein n=1 Tax=Synechococcus sp. Nb3U1 TaxID=1914529 RepID=UPI001F25A00D|nr:transposase [Synechococcus sp. Nb3U1]MCF2969961.1 transposase [Synechococcus sp. Nb3U1]
MRIAYQYKLLPSTLQLVTMNRWLDMLRQQYNWMLADWFDWWEMNRCLVNACPLVCNIAEPREKPEYYGQKRSLVRLKRDRPWYKEIHSQVLQDMVKRVKLAFARYLKGDCNGKRSGKLRFKGVNRYRSFTYPQASIDWIDSNKIELPKIGAVKVVWNRPLPPGFEVKSAILSRKADGWYITLSLQDDSVPEQTIDVVPNWDNSIGLDMGLEHFVADSEGELIDYPRFLRQAKSKLAKLQQKCDARPKGSVARKKLSQRIARLHQKIARQRYQFHCETANQLLIKADVVFVEDFNLSNMTKRCKPKQDENGTFLPNGQAAKAGLNKSFADAGISQFVNQILPFKAEKAGKRRIKVNPTGTSQHCCVCLNRVPKELSDRWHSCPECKAEMPRDTNSGVLIKKVGLGLASLKKAQRATARKEARALCVGTSLP